MQCACDRAVWETVSTHQRCSFGGDIRSQECGSSEENCKAGAELAQVRNHGTAATRSAMEIEPPKPFAVVLAQISWAAHGTAGLSVCPAVFWTCFDPFLCIPLFVTLEMEMSVLCD